MKDISDYIDSHFTEVLTGLRDLIRLRSVSARGTELPETARAIEVHFKDLGFDTELLSYGDAPPAVYAHLKGASETTLLFYNHYDVQPEEPVKLWNSDPFELTERDGKLYARGVADDKGDIVSRLWAIRALLERDGTLPVSVKFFIEGEEEIGSPHLEVAMSRFKDLLSADACVWESGSMGHEGNPIIELGVKGMVYVELRTEGAKRDLHSSKAAVVESPLWRLIWALNTLKGPDERILIRGFYDDVRPPNPMEIEAIRTVPHRDVSMKKDLGLDRFVLGVEGEEFTRRLIMEPSLNVAGIHGGYTGTGSKTVLPREAFCKMDIRLVPDQDPAKVLEALREHLKASGFDDVKVVELGTLEHPARTPMNHPFVELVARSGQETYEKPAYLIPNMSGTGPMYPIVKALGVPVASAGINSPGNAMHAPDENVRIDTFKRGTAHVARILEGMADLEF
jgi:acetylornithine deacetylase/succinyl-diaminopimelate desuccinylase-like protein